MRIIIYNLQVMAAAWEQLSSDRGLQLSFHQLHPRMLSIQTTISAAAYLVSKSAVMRLE